MRIIEVLAPGERLPLLRQLVDEDGYEDDVVYPEHDLQDQQREESDPGLGIEQQVHASHLAFLSPDKAFVSRVV
jgi:hypothetical protein